MSDKIINAIRLLVEDGAEVTYSSNKQQPTDYYQGYTAGILEEQSRILDLIREEMPLVFQEQFIQLLKGHQK